MSNTSKVAKAKLVQMKTDFSGRKDGGKEVPVQFNPDSLKVSYSNQVTSPQNTGNSPTSGQTTPRQFVAGAGTSKLTLTLWFDVGAQDPDDSKFVADVREMTHEVLFFITPEKVDETYVIPATSFQWGSFRFDGFIDTLDETYEFFSADGVPLRASVSIAMSNQRIEFLSLPVQKSPPGAGSSGTQALLQVKAGASLQASVGASAGVSTSWQAVAEANGIENPRQLQAGQLVNLKVKK
jgi:hypothetical protein